MQVSRLDTRLRQLNIWVVQLGKSELYGKLLGAKIRCGTPTQQQVFLVKHNKKSELTPPLYGWYQNYFRLLTYLHYICCTKGITRLWRCKPLDLQSASSTLGIASPNTSTEPLLSGLCHWQPCLEHLNSWKKSKFLKYNGYHGTH